MTWPAYWPYRAMTVWGFKGGYVVYMTAVYVPGVEGIDVGYE